MRLAFIGGWGHRCLLGLAAGAGGRVSAVAVAGDGRDEARARAGFEGVPAELGPRWFDDPREMIEKFRPDVVNIGTYYGRNGELAAMALERDVPVVSDKPVAATWGQLARLRELVKENPRRRIVAEFPFRSHAAFRAARGAVAGGALGRVVLAVAQKSYRFGEARPAWYGEREEYGSTVLWVASHAIDFTAFVTGERYAAVWGQAGNVSRGGYGTMEEYTVNVFQLRGGGSAVVHADYNRPVKAATHGDDRLRVAGERGQVEIREGRCVLTTNERAAEDITDSVAVRPVYEEMLDAVMGKDESIYSTAETLEMAGILLTARDAADQQKRVEIEG